MAGFWGGGRGKPGVVGIEAVAAGLEKAVCRVWARDGSMAEVGVETRELELRDMAV